MSYKLCTCRSLDLFVRVDISRTARLNFLEAGVGLSKLEKRGNLTYVTG